MRKWDSLSDDGSQGGNGLLDSLNLAWGEPAELGFREKCFRVASVGPLWSWVRWKIQVFYRKKKKTRKKKKKKVFKPPHQ